MPPQEGSLKKKTEGEFVEDEKNISKLIEVLIKSFLRTDSDYGAITDIKTDINNVYRILRDYIVEEKLDICTLKLNDHILMSKTSAGFEDIYTIIKENSQLKIKKDTIEIWDDSKNKIIHFLIMPLRKHFPIEYETDQDRERIIDILLREYSEGW